MSKKLKSDIMLLITAIIWGSAFVAQKAGTVLEPFTYNGIRMLIGGLVLILSLIHISTSFSFIGRRMRPNPSFLISSILSYMIASPLLNSIIYPNPGSGIQSHIFPFTSGNKTCIIAEITPPWQTTTETASFPLWRWDNSFNWW